MYTMIAFKNELVYKVNSTIILRKNQILRRKALNLCVKVKFTHFFLYIIHEKKQI